MELSQSHHSKSNTFYELHEFRNTNTTSILDTKKLWKVFLKKKKKKRKTLSEKSYYSISVIHYLQDNLITGKLHDICFFLPPSHYIKLLKLLQLSHNNYGLWFPLYKTGMLVHVSHVKIAMANCITWRTTPDLQSPNRGKAIQVCQHKHQLQLPTYHLNNDLAIVLCLTHQVYPHQNKNLTLSIKDKVSWHIKFKTGSFKKLASVSILPLSLMIFQ